MELLSLALALEEDLQNFYLKQAQLHQENDLHIVFELLAKEEEKHVEILMNYADKIDLPLMDSDILSKVRPIFKEMADFKSDIKLYATQLDAYRMALDKEVESLNFYKDLRDKSEGEQLKQVFRYLIQQEDRHCIILEELVKLVTRPEEWVESAEFGLREDY
jgi:rubrerythrin